ncbi:MAG TPA: dihydroorotase, partial [Thermodesulfobacteriota bacterium]|nr:dihydroorotase [Thermodesulfobacteriota bacterium]
MNILIKGGRIIDPSRNFDKVGNILIEKGTIKSYPEDIKKLEKDSEVKVIDARGKIVAPGLVDLHVHLR